MLSAPLATVMVQTLSVPGASMTASALVKRPLSATASASSTTAATAAALVAPSAVLAASTVAAVSPVQRWIDKSSLAYNMQ
jgi:hypothetical protein